VWTTITVKGDGIKDVQYDTKWDLFIHLDIKIPKKLGKKERELYEEIAKEKKVNVCDKKGIFEKIFG
jgi:molecular chaperone DnaJ